MSAFAFRAFTETSRVRWIAIRVTMAIVIMIAAVSISCTPAPVQAGPLRASSLDQPELSITLPMDDISDYCQGRITWDQHSEYHTDLLRLAADLSGYKITITPVCMDYPTEDRRIAMLLSADQINTVYFGTTPNREDTLLAAYMPIYLGTTGLRLFMARPETAARLEAVTSVEELRKFTMGQGLGWPDGKILIDQGFSVAYGRYKTLHRMLDAKRFDLYPRAYWQIAGEWSWMKDQAPGIIVTSDVALYYPQPIYFFFSPKEPDLRDAIEAGLIKAHATGKLLDLLRAHPDTSPSFSQIDLDKIRVIRAENPEISEKSLKVMKTYGLFP